MADLTITPGSVLKGTGAATQNFISGQPNGLNAGDVAYKATSGQYLKATAGGNSTQAGSAGLVVALDSTPGIGQPFVGLLAGQWNPGNSGSLSNGQTYCVSVQHGKICPISDLVSGNYVSILGGGLNSNTIQSPTKQFFVLATPKS